MRAWCFLLRVVLIEQQTRNLEIRRKSPGDFFTPTYIKLATDSHTLHRGISWTAVTGSLFMYSGVCRAPCRADR